MAENIYAYYDDENYLDDYEPPTEEEKKVEKEKSNKIRTEIKQLKHYLNSAWYWEKRANRLSDKIQVLRSQAEKITTSYSDAPTFGGFEDHRQAIIAEMVDLQNECESARKECTRKFQEIQFFISLLSDYRERIVCEYRYLNYYGWLDIAMALDYSVQNVTKIHGKALQNLLEEHKKMVTNGGKGLF